MKKLFILLFTISSFPSFAQFSSLDTLFQIQLGTYKESVDFSQFQDLKNIGKIRVTSIRPELMSQLSDTTRVYLGVYIGRYTAKLALLEAQRHGYVDAKLEYAPFPQSITAEHRAVQLGAFYSFKMRQFDSINQVLYILYENDMFKVFSFIYHPDQLTKGDKKFMLELGTEEGFAPFERRLISGAK